MKQDIPQEEKRTLEQEAYDAARVDQMIDDGYNSFTGEVYLGR